MTAKTLMIQGTASSAGKSLLVAALCRIFRQDGVRVASEFGEDDPNGNPVSLDPGTLVHLFDPLSARGVELHKDLSGKLPGELQTILRQASSLALSWTSLSCTSLGTWS